MKSKTLSLKDAIKRFVKPNCSIFFAGMQHGEPSGAIHEIVRQRIGNLTAIPMLNDTIALLFGEGLVRKFITAIIGEITSAVSIKISGTLKEPKYSLAPIPIDIIKNIKDFILGF